MKHCVVKPRFEITARSHYKKKKTLTVKLKVASQLKKEMLIMLSFHYVIVNGNICP